MAGAQQLGSTWQHVGAGAQQVGAALQQVGAGAQQLGSTWQPPAGAQPLEGQQVAGAQQLGSTTQHFGVGAQQLGSVWQHMGAGAQQLASFLHSPPNKPASAWPTETAQTIMAAVRVIHFISAHLLVRFPRERTTESIRSCRHRVSKQGYLPVPTFHLKQAVTTPLISSRPGCPGDSFGREFRFLLRPARRAFGCTDFAR